MYPLMGTNEAAALVICRLLDEASDVPFLFSRLFVSNL